MHGRVSKPWGETMGSKLFVALVLAGIYSPSVVADKKAIPAGELLKGKGKGACYIVQNGRNYMCNEYINLPEELIESLKAACESANKDPNNKNHIVSRWNPNESCTRKEEWGECRVDVPESVTVWYAESIKDPTPGLKDSLISLCKKAHNKWVAK